jgi:predicted  nucleic acid-binding Zn-ribbon protein
MKRVSRTILVGVAALGLALSGGAQERQPASAQAEAEADTVVACLLPARVRRLGGVVYPARRVLTSNTVRKCQLRGGEYTTYDRASPENSAAFFLPLANGGDAVAQTRLGEVYEYLFDPPRYDDARAWYEKAAAQENPEGLRRLARLYENGLGVEKDGLKATNLWREATGSGDELVLASTLDAVRTDAEQRIAALTEELNARNADAESLRQDLARVESESARRNAEYATAQRALEQQKAELAATRANLVAAGDTERVATLERELEAKQREIDDQRYRIESLDADLEAKQAQLAGTMRQANLSNERLTAELARVKVTSQDQLATARRELESRNSALEALQQERASLQATVDTQARDLERATAALTAAKQSDDAAARAQVAELERRARTANEALAASRKQIDALGARVATAEQETATLKGSLADAATERDRLAAQIAENDARLLQSQAKLDATAAALRQATADITRLTSERSALETARATAKGGEAKAVELERALADGNRQIALLEKRVSDLDAARAGLEADVVKLRGERERTVAMRGVFDPLPDTSRIVVPKGIALGKYHAVVIGNNNYTTLPPLKGAQADARRVHDILSSAYGFRSELVLDATRRDVANRIEGLQEQLSSEDFLLVYFAGHGVETPAASYWLGVDAPSASSKLDLYGVSSDELSRWLQGFDARHVLVVADSCYSGAGISSLGGMKFKAADVQRQLGFFLRNRARTILTSGGHEPVPDNDAGNGSVFTRTFVALLRENTGYLSDVDLYGHLKERVRFAAGPDSVGVPTPVFAHVDGDHGAGQFVFIRPSVLDVRS